MSASLVGSEMCIRDIILTIRQAVRLFARALREYASVALAPEWRQRFQQAAPELRLQSIGFRTAVSCLKVAPMWTSERWRRVA
eukprot:7174343-Alexandrium_andersonii.AAC.1